MAGLADYIRILDDKNELYKVKVQVDFNLEITEIVDRISKERGDRNKAVLFENTGKDFPILINIFGSDLRMKLALNLSDYYQFGKDLNRFFEALKNAENGLKGKFSALNFFRNNNYFLPTKLSKKGACQENIFKETDLSLLPIMKCWPFDGGSFITLPCVHTVNPKTGVPNMGMYRMQMFDKATTGMHWHLHKTGEKHFRMYKKAGKRMPVSVTLGGHPAYTYAATAPLPDNIDELMLAGFLMKRKVRLVKCLTNDLYVPEDVDFVIEGYVDPMEDKVTEGPFGDHTGFYSLSDKYPKFHVTCITHKNNAIYPSTIVGIPPQEDAEIGEATEQLFLPLIQKSMLPEIMDFHLPKPGVAHNLVVTKIKPEYPGHGFKVMNALWGAGQMMFSKVLLLVNDTIDIRDYGKLLSGLVSCDLSNKIHFTKGPADVLEHASSELGFGSKMGIDLTGYDFSNETRRFVLEEKKESESGYIYREFHSVINKGIIVYVSNEIAAEEWYKRIKDKNIVVLMDEHTKNISLYHQLWHILSNIDPQRDINIIEGVKVDARSKVASHFSFKRPWPNPVCMNEDVIRKVDERWGEYDIGDFIESPSKQFIPLMRNGNAEVDKY